MNDIDACTWFVCLKKKKERYMGYENFPAKSIVKRELYSDFLFTSRRILEGSCEEAPLRQLIACT